MSKRNSVQKPKKDYKYPDNTTIALSKEHAAALNDMKRNSFESYDDVLNRLFINQVDVWVEFILIDNGLPQLHTAVFQLGDDKQSLYLWNGDKLLPLKLEEAENLMKLPKPELLAVTKQDAESLVNTLVLLGITLPSAGQVLSVPAYDKLKKFLEQKPKDGNA